MFLLCRMSISQNSQPVQFPLRCKRLCLVFWAFSKSWVNIFDLISKKNKQYILFVTNMEHILINKQIPHNNSLFPSAETSFKGTSLTNLKSTIPEQITLLFQMTVQHLYFFLPNSFHKANMRRKVTGRLPSGCSDLTPHKTTLGFVARERDL